jgi:hypothetical protein
MYSQLSTISPETQIFYFVYLSSGHNIYVSKEEGQWLFFEAKMVRHKKSLRNTDQTLTGRGRRRVETVLTLSDPTSDLVRQYNFPVLLRCRKTSYTVFAAFVRPLSEPVRRFSSCSTDFS